MARTPTTNGAVCSPFILYATAGLSTLGSSNSAPVYIWAGSKATGTHLRLRTMHTQAGLDKASALDESHPLAESDLPELVDEAMENEKVLVGMSRGSED
ncbi:hypothetical protein K488DRAFT_90601 [Vararia minispora EC-137]|uniref:Uncharacterized protein n=1 Tax=Vararia minispora EC-137 TaxID=1314806 RepID=A0ACB8Q7G9_9AGAM|nr:hypothetical protein K488DRAFT_90601 [Vararia minispora EC-137]